MLGLGSLPGLGGPASGDASDAETGEGNNLDVPAGCNMGRRRSRAVLYQLSGHYKPEKGGVKTKLKLGNVSKSNPPKQGRTFNNHKPQRTAHHDQFQLNVWFAFVVFVAVGT